MCLGLLGKRWTSLKRVLVYSTFCNIFRLILFSFLTRRCVYTDSFVGDGRYGAGESGGMAPARFECSIAIPWRKRKRSGSRNEISLAGPSRQAGTANLSPRCWLIISIVCSELASLWRDTIGTHGRSRSASENLSFALSRRTEWTIGSVIRSADGDSKIPLVL